MSATRREPVRALRRPHAFRTALVRWFLRSRRPLPWRARRTPYRVWVAEVLLQQTRVNQATKYFDRFLARFPTVAALARASEDSVLKALEGSGYYARARNLRKAAIELVRYYDGRLPRTVEELEELPGVGPYIARAIGALAFRQPVIALEANGLRVAARLLLETGDLRSPTIRHRLTEGLESALDPQRPDVFNEALMELGETLCLPQRPRCDLCPVATFCEARQTLPDPGVIPQRPAALPRATVRASIVAVRWKDRWLVRRRPSSGLLGGLWEFPGGKIEPGESPIRAAQRELEEESGVVAPELRFRGYLRHSYSHFDIDLGVFEGSLEGRQPPRTTHGRWVTDREFERLAKPMATEKALALLRPSL